MKKIKCFLLLLVSLTCLVSCSNNNDDDSEETIEVLGSADISTAFWDWQKDINGGYNVTLYLTYYQNEEDNKGVEKGISITPNKTTVKANNCTEDGLDRYIASYVVDGVTIQSHKDVITPAKGHHFTNYVDDGDAHLMSCECGLIDTENRIPHAYIDDNNQMSETCEFCNHTRFTDSYRANKISNIKNSIANLIVPHSLEEAVNNLTRNSVVYKLIDSLEDDDASKLTAEEMSKLLSVAYNYRIFMNASDYHSYKISTLTTESYVVNDDYIQDEEYGNLRTFNIPEAIPQRLVYNKKDEDPVINPASGVGVDYQNTVFNTIEIPNFPEISSVVNEIGFKIYVPVEGISYRLLGYYSFPSSLTKAYAYINDDTLLNEGWNTITFTDFSSFKNITHIYIELKDCNGALPAGDYKLTSIISSYDDVSNLEEEIAQIPAINDLNITYCEKILSAYNLYNSLDSNVKEFINGRDKLLKSYNEYASKFTYSLGKSIYLTNSSDLYTPMNAYSIAGNTMYEINANGQSVFKGLIKASDPLNNAHETLGFLTYQEGDNDIFGNTNNTKFEAYNNTWGDYVILNTIHIYGNWYLHYIPLDMIDDYVINGAKTIYSASYIRFGVFGIPLKSTNSNPLYISTLYSFDTSLI